MKFSITYIDNFNHYFATEFWDYSLTIWADYWDAARNDEITITACQFSYDGGETWESVLD